MMDRTLIEEIVSEVLNKLNAISSPKKTLYAVNAKKVTKKTLEKLTAHWELKHITAFPDEHVPDIEHVLFLNGTLDLIAKGALGICDTFESELLSHFILKSVTIDIVLNEQITWLADNTINPPINIDYVKTFMNYKEKLERYGVTLVTLEKFISIHSQSYINRKVSQNQINYHAKLLTQTDIEQSPYNPIVISKTTIVTPLARDRAREKGITIHVAE